MSTSFIWVKGPNHQVCVNLAHLVHFEKDGKGPGTVIRLTQGGLLHTEDTPQEVNTAIFWSCADAAKRDAEAARPPQ